MNRLNLSNSLFLVIICCFFFSLLLGGLVLWPKLRDLKVIQNDIARKEAELQAEEAFFESLNKIKNELKDYEPELAKINSALPDDQSLPSLFNFFQKASSLSGLILKGISPFAVSQSNIISYLKETQFSLQLTGSYSSFKNFLGAIEKSARLIEVGNISFSAPAEEDLFNFNIRIKVNSY